MALIGACYSYGLKSGYLPKNTTNPAPGIEKFGEQTRKRYLSEAELSRLGEAIREAEITEAVVLRADRNRPNDGNNEQQKPAAEDRKGGAEKSAKFVFGLSRNPSWIAFACGRNVTRNSAATAILS